MRESGNVRVGRFGSVWRRPIDRQLCEKVDARAEVSEGSSGVSFCLCGLNFVQCRLR